MPSSVSLPFVCRWYLAILNASNILWGKPNSVHRVMKRHQNSLFIPVGFFSTKIERYLTTLMAISKLICWLFETLLRTAWKWQNPLLNGPNSDNAISDVCPIKLYAMLCQQIDATSWFQFHQQPHDYSVNGLKISAYIFRLLWSNFYSAPL